MIYEFDLISINIFIQASIFNQAVLKIEGDEVSAIEMTVALDNLLQSLTMRRDSQFLSSDVQKEMDKLNTVQEGEPSSGEEDEPKNDEDDEQNSDEDDEANSDQEDEPNNDFISRDEVFYDTCIDYLNQWKLQFDDLRIFDWARLAAAPNWKDIDATIKFMKEKKNG